MPASDSFATRLFIAAGRLSAAMPHFRGKTRAFLVLYRLLGVDGRHVHVRAKLRRPVVFEAELDLHSWLQRVAFLTGGYEQDTVQFLADLYRRIGAEGSLLDVGANVGLISIPFVRSTHTSAIAIEAVPDNVVVLRKNVRLNGLGDAISIVPYALGATAGVAQIQVEGDLEAGEGTGTANILADGTTYECVRQDVRVRTLDELLDSGELPRRCSVVKIDTDGYDLKVLQGGPRLLARDRPVIFGEFSAHCLNWHGQSLADVVAFADANDYLAWRRRMPEWRFTRSLSAGTFEQDLLLVPRERADAFSTLLAS